MRKITLSGDGPLTIGGKEYPSIAAVPAAILLDPPASHASGARLSHLTREVIARQAAGRLADKSFPAAKVKAAVRDGFIPSQAEAAAHLAALEAAKVKRQAAKRQAATKRQTAAKVKRQAAKRQG